VSIFTWLRRLVLVTVGALALAALGGGAGAAGRGSGLYVTPSGFQVPMYGTYVATDPGGRVTTSCSRLSDDQIRSLYVSSETARATLAWAPRAVVQAAGMTFTIVYTDVASGFNDPERGAERRTALEATMRGWGNALGGSVPVVIEVKMETLAANLGASAGPTDFVIFDGRILPLSLAAQLRNAPVNGGRSDITARFNTAVDWDYNASGVAAAGKVSFIYTALHEVAHGLGFLSTFSQETGRLSAELPTPFDVWINRGSAAESRLVSRQPDQVKADVLSGDLFFAGPNAIRAGLASVRPLPMVKLYAPAVWEPGSSVSHVDQETYSDVSVGLMRPTDVGGGTSVVDGLTTAMMSDLGYQLAGAAAARKR